MACPPQMVPGSWEGDMSPLLSGRRVTAEWAFDVQRSPCLCAWPVWLLGACSLSLNTLFSRGSANGGRESPLVILSGADPRPSDSQPSFEAPKMGPSLFPNRNTKEQVS